MIRLIISTFLIAFWILAPLGTTAAQEITWVTVEGSVPLSKKNQDKARQEALAAAERNAVIEALASRITLDNLLVNLRLAGTILGAIPYGKVVQKEILEEGPASIKTASSKKLKVYRVRIKAAVTPEEEENESGFQLNAALNQIIFKEGDELEIHLQSNRTCYFAVFNILEGNTIVQLLPNSRSTKNQLPANVNYTFPGEKERKDRLTLRLYLPKGKQAITEAIYVMALLKPFELTSMKVQDQSFNTYSGQRTFMKDVIRAAVTVPMSQRAEALLQYEVRKTGNGL